MNWTKLLIVLVLISLVAPIAQATFQYDTEFDDDATLISAPLTYYGGATPGVANIAACQRFNIDEPTNTLKIKAPLKVQNSGAISQISQILFELRETRNPYAVKHSCSVTSQKGQLSPNDYNDLECDITSENTINVADVYVCIRVDYSQPNLANSYLGTKSDNSDSDSSKILAFTGNSWNFPNSDYDPNDLAISVEINDDYARDNSDYDFDGIINSRDNCWYIPNPVPEGEEKQADLDNNCESVQSTSNWADNKWIDDPECGDACDGVNIYNFMECPIGFIKIAGSESDSNSHIDLTDDENYQFDICARDPYGDLILDGTDGAFIMSVSGNTNAHVSKNEGEYGTNNIYLDYDNGRRSPICAWKESTSICADEGFPDVIFSISGDTNAHAGDVEAYSDNVYCCRFNGGPIIELENRETSVNTGDTVTFNPIVTDPDTDDLTFKWTKSVNGGTPISEGLTESISITPDKVGEYELIFYASDCAESILVENCASATSVKVHIYVGNPAPLIELDPIEQNINRGEDVTFIPTVSDENNEFLNYKWEMISPDETKQIVGTTKDLTLTSDKLVNIGTYLLKFYVSDCEDGGFECDGTTTIDASVIVENIDPIISEVKIIPESPTASSTIECVATVSDADNICTDTGDCVGITHCGYLEPILLSDSTNPNNVRLNECVSLGCDNIIANGPTTFTCYDEEGVVEPYLPCAPFNPDQCSKLNLCNWEASQNCVNVDILTYKFTWYNMLDESNPIQTSGESVQPKNEFEGVIPNGANLKCVVEVNDGNLETPITGEATVSISNREPTLVLKQKYIELFRDDVLELDASQSTDDDADSLTFVWTQPDGPDLEINGANNAIATATIPRGDIFVDDYKFTITLSDGFVEKTGDVIVKVLNHAPEIDTFTTSENPQVNEDLLCEVLAVDKDRIERDTDCIGNSRTECGIYSSLSDCEKTWTGCEWITTGEDHCAGTRNQCINHVKEPACTSDGCSWNTVHWDVTFEDLTYTFNWYKNAETVPTKTEEFTVIGGDGANAKSILAATEVSPDDKWVCDVSVTDGLATITDSKEILLTNTNPTAGFTSPDYCVVGEKCKFTSTSTDLETPESLTLSWDFDGALPADSNEVEPAYIFTTPGIIEVKLIATDPGAYSDEYVAEVIVYARPVANFIEPEYCVVDESCEFKSTSTDADTELGLLTYSWSFGDTDAETTHTFTEATEEVTITLTVTDEQQLSATHEYNLSVYTRPQALFTEPELCIVGTPCEFKSTSSDPDGDTLTYNWDLGNGATSTNADNLVTYVTPGEYTVSLTVTDENGLTKSDTYTFNAYILGDITGGEDGIPDNCVDFDDFSLLLFNYNIAEAELCTKSYFEGNLDFMSTDSGCVDFDDFSLLINKYGEGCS